MSDLPRRSIDDLVLRYELEPDLNDIYVEGHFDKEVLTACFQHAQDPSRIVYTIDSVDVPEAILRKYKLTEGNKQRVLALAQELSGIDILRCRFLVDRDIDHWFEELVQSKGLVWTKYCSLELYFFTDELLQKLIVTVSRCKVGKWGEFVQSFSNALIMLYSFRLADRELDLNLQWIDFDKSLSFREGLLSFDFDSYASKILNKNAKMPFIGNFKAKALEWHKRCLDTDCKMAIRGHDFVKVLAWVIKNGRGNSALGSEDAIERALLLITTSDLELYSDISS
ncbi:DUF4435 domain-containing protein [Pseudomonas gingeri]|uniref:DUF4435 domain-containing protein n=1 Tax=Pseudomonas gingeri TaxID=117681 RepID=A0A7Y7XFT5_9PSED|nr:DUF4435 domain-containing protein [Pseudomonas gingeri]NWB99098.1 DUF4435 domain-containing protein [Pseudomonas gingeri]